MQTFDQPVPRECQTASELHCLYLNTCSITRTKHGEYAIWETTRTKTNTQNTTNVDTAHYIVRWS